MRKLYENRECRTRQKKQGMITIEIQHTISKSAPEAKSKEELRNEGAKNIYSSSR